MINRNLPPVVVNRFSLVPRSDVPRSTFHSTHAHKTAFQGGYLVPIHVDEVLPGDHIRCDVAIFARMATMIFPVMDGITLETFFFFVPNRLLWTNWVKFQGERANPGDSIAYTIPTHDSAAGGFPINSIWDYFGLPTVGQVTAGQVVTVNALPLRAYNLIWNEWFRDQNIDNALTVNLGDGPDGASYALRRRRKRHDYFTSCLPWPVKGGAETTIPLSGQANVMGIGLGNIAATAGTPAATKEAGNVTASGWSAYAPAATANFVFVRANAPAAGTFPIVYADLSTGGGVTLNAMRLAVASQQILERDARSGTRYTEMLRGRWGVDPQDYRLQRPEYIGGGRSSIQTNAIPQTAPAAGGSTPLANLGAMATVSDRHDFELWAVEHGYVIGLVHVGADISYSQGLRRLWTRSSRFDFYMPEFANLGEQAVRNDELYCTGTDATDTAVFGYQERWAEYRHFPSLLTGLLRSTSAGNIDEWHLAQQFSSQPTLNATFIEDNPPFSRVLAAGALADNQQVIFDSVFQMERTRAMPQYSVPGLDRF